jgi:hypothetical protein
MQYGQAALKWSMDMEHGDVDMQQGHAWTSSMGMQQVFAAWTNSMFM